MKWLRFWWIGSSYLEFSPITKGYCAVEYTENAAYTDAFDLSAPTTAAEVKTLYYWRQPKNHLLIHDKFEYFDR